jgi:hypothetical protein
MKKFKNLPLIGILILFVLLISCSKNEVLQSSKGNNILGGTITNILTEEEIASLVSLKQSHDISIDEAQKEAINVMNLLHRSNNLKDGVKSNLRISNVKSLWHEHSISGLKSGEQDSVAVHLFNFADDKGDKAGYALISGDDRLPAVLSCSNNGNLSDTISNPGLAVFLSRTPDYIDSKLKEFEENKSNKFNKAIEKVEEQLPDSIREQMIEQGSSGLKSLFGLFRWEVDVSYGAWKKEPDIGCYFPVLWSQRSPYNDPYPQGRL